jgi:hypothetical protein
MKPKFDETMEQMEAFRQGMDRGRELAIQQYDKAFVELDDKLNHIIRKLDTVLEAKDK